MGNSTIEQVRDEAEYQARYDQPKVRSTTVQTIRFSGTFTPTDSDKAIVIFSDDGCRVTIDGIVVFDRLNRGQHLPNLGQSFHLLPFILEKGKQYTIKVEYSNVLYTGEGDMDGASLFLFDGKTMDLTAVDYTDASNSVNISPLICQNAQTFYKKAKWKVTLPTGTTAKVSSSGAVGINFEGVDGSDPNALQDGQFFLVTPTGNNTGNYEIKLALNNLNTVSIKKGSKAFKFEFAYASANITSSTSGGGSVNENANRANGFVVPNVRGQTDGAEVTRIYDLKVTSNPDTYAGKVKGRAQFTFNLPNWRIELRRFPSLAGLVSIEASFSIVNVTFVGGGSSGNSIAGVNIKIEIDGNTSLGQDIGHSADEIGFAVFTGTSKAWNTPAMNVVLNDLERTYTVGTPIPMKAQVGAVSKTTDILPVRTDVMDCHAQFGTTDPQVAPVPSSTFQIVP